MNKLIIVAVVVIVVVIGGFFLVSGNKTSQVTETQPTLSPSTSEGVSPTASMSESDVSETEVELTTDGFTPAKVTIKVGDKVVWNNNSGGAATVSSDPHPAHTLYPIINLGPFNDGDNHSVVFDKAGTYTYHNHLDASQKGTVVVE